MRYVSNVVYFALVAVIGCAACVGEGPAPTGAPTAVSPGLPGSGPVEPSLSMQGKLDGQPFSPTNVVYGLRNNGTEVLVKFTDTPDLCGQIRRGVLQKGAHEMGFFLVTRVDATSFAPVAVPGAFTVDDQPHVTGKLDDAPTQLTSAAPGDHALAFSAAFDAACGTLPQMAHSGQSGTVILEAQNPASDAAVLDPNKPIGGSLNLQLDGSDNAVKATHFVAQPCPELVDQALLVKATCQ